MPATSGTKCCTSIAYYWMGLETMLILYSVAGAAWTALELVPGALDSVRGVGYPAAFKVFAK